MRILREFELSAYIKLWWFDSMGRYPVNSDQVELLYDYDYMPFADSLEMCHPTTEFSSPYIGM